MADLITLQYAQSALSRLDLSTAEAAYLPSAVTQASDAVRRHCGDRDFIQQAYDKILTISLDGTVSLPQIPVLRVSRVAAGRQAALTIANTDRTGNQRATVEPTCAGDEWSGVTYTGITLSRKSAGVTTASPLAFATYTTLAALAAAVGALGSGWSATVTSGYEMWGTDELISQDDAGQDCLSGATLDVWARDLAGCKLDRKTGILDVSTGDALNYDGPRWGPGWETFELDERQTYSRVRVVYTAGFVTVPTPVQQAVVHVIQSTFATLRQDPKLKSENDGSYSYTLNDKATFAITPEAAELLAPWVLHRT